MPVSCKCIVKKIATNRETHTRGRSIGRAGCTVMKKGRRVKIAVNLHSRAQFFAAATFRIEREEMLLYTYIHIFARLLLSLCLLSRAVESIAVKFRRVRGLKLRWTRVSHPDGSCSHHPSLSPPAPTLFPRHIISRVTEAF